MQVEPIFPVPIVIDTCAQKKPKCSEHFGFQLFKKRVYNSKTAFSPPAKSFHW